MAGLDPAIHVATQHPVDMDARMPGSSPGMTRLGNANIKLHTGCLYASASVKSNILFFLAPLLRVVEAIHESIEFLFRHTLFAIRRD